MAVHVANGTVGQSPRGSQTSEVAAASQLGEWRGRAGAQNSGSHPLTPGDRPTPPVLCSSQAEQEAQGHR